MNNVDYSQEDKERNRPLAPFSSSINIGKNSRRRRGLHKGSSAFDSGQLITDNELDMTLILSTCDNNINDLMANPNNSSNDNSCTNLLNNDITTSCNNNINIEQVFSAPGVIIRDLYDLYKCNKPLKERESALLDYVKLFPSKNCTS